MMKKTMKLALILGSSLAVSGVAVAQSPEVRPDRAERMKRFDANGDGQLDQAERDAMRAEHKQLREARKAEMLAKYDTNRDGKLDETERKAIHEARATERFKQLDRNGDNVLSLDEFKAAEGRRGGGKRFGGKGFRGGR